MGGFKTRFILLWFFKTNFKVTFFKLIFIINLTPSPNIYIYKVHDYSNSDKKLWLKKKLLFSYFLFLLSLLPLTLTLNL